VDKIVTVPAGLCGLFLGARVIVTAPTLGHGLCGYVRRVNAEWCNVDFDDGGFGSYFPEHLGLLFDSWQAMCHASRWLATQLGMDPGDTAPFWTYSPETIVEGDDAWILTVVDEARWFRRKTACFYGNDSPDGHDKHVQVEAYDVPTMLTAAEALAAACLKVGGAS
jgi:hypothetical protein